MQRARFHFGRSCLFFCRIDSKIVWKAIKDKHFTWNASSVILETESKPYAPREYERDDCCEGKDGVIPAQSKCFSWFCQDNAAKDGGLG